MNLIWWEKTVEYRFIVEVALSKSVLLTALAGKPEQAGDTMVSSDNRWILIEFKKNAGAIRTERDKFYRYEDAFEALSSSDAHHHIIYGHQDPDAQRMHLRFQTYFSGQARRSIQEVLGSGIELGAFRHYVERFTRFKKGPQGASGGLSMDEFSLVAAVNAEGKVAQCLSLSEFQRERCLVQEREMDLGRGYDDGPSR
jgi:hypothetical protein